MAPRPDKRKARPATKRHYPRTARLNTLLQQIVADYLERVDDDQLGLLTVTGVEVDADLNKALVYFSTLAEASPEADEETLAILAGYRKAIQAEIGRSARMRKTPEVVFAFDPAVRTGARIEHILSSLHRNDGGEQVEVHEASVDETGETGPDAGTGTGTEP
jgi:ribosome-binding factor A